MPMGVLTAVAFTAAMQVGLPAPMEAPNYPALTTAFSQHGFEGQYEQRHPFDTQQNWVHGYFQEIPAYGGHAFFRPYNYKDVLSQSQTAAGWGMSPTMPYSQQFWHRYHDQATMLKLSQRGTAQPAAGSLAGPWNPHPHAGETGWAQLPSYSSVPAQTPYLPPALPAYGPAMTMPVSGASPVPWRY